MYPIKGEPRLSAKGHEVFAEMHAESASDLRRAAAEQPESPDAPELIALAARQEGASKGHLFRARELRYDARGGMTRAQAAEQVIDVLTEIMEAGAKPGRERDDMAEEQGETWDEPRKGDGRC